MRNSFTLLNPMQTSPKSVAGSSQSAKKPSRSVIAALKDAYRRYGTDKFTQAATKHFLR